MIRKYLNFKIILKYFRYANLHNPDEKSFNDLLVKVNNDLTMVSELCRNNTSMQHQVLVIS